MRTFMIAAIIAMLAVPAHAQMGQGKGGGSGGKLGQKSDEQTATEQQQKRGEWQEFQTQSTSAKFLETPQRSFRRQREDFRAQDVAERKRARSGARKSRPAKTPSCRQTVRWRTLQSRRARARAVRRH